MFDGSNQIQEDSYLAISRNIWQISHYLPGKQITSTITFSKYSLINFSGF